MDEEEESVESLLDQLPIVSTSSSSHKDEVELPRIQRAKIMPRKISKKLESVLTAKTPITNRYFTAGQNVTKETSRDVNKEQCPFAYPSDLEEFAHKVRTKAWRDGIRVKALQQKCQDKLGYKGRQRKDILQRLYVEEPIVKSMKTVLDIDPEYFNLVEGRPIPDKVDIRTYIETVRESLRTRIMIGYREDDIMLIEENLLLEQKMIDTIRGNLQTYVGVFEEFLYRDHISAVNLLKESDSISCKAFDKYEELRNIQKKFGALRSSFFSSEEKWRNCKLYQSFLFEISPLEWRQQKDPSLTRQDKPNIDLFRNLSVSDEKEISLTDILDKFKEECEGDSEPDIYFVVPEQLLDVFKFMEMQNLNSLLHCEELAVPLDNVKQGMRHAAATFDANIKNMVESIERLAGGILWEEERAKFLEDLANRLIVGEFKKIIMDDDILSLHVFVEDVYETRVGPNDANLGMLEMMQGIEEKYRSELLLMDKVPAEQIQLLEGSAYLEQARIMKMAEIATRQHAELEKLLSSVYKAFAPAFQKAKQRELKYRSALIERKKEPPPPPRDLTEQEVEYLEYFTEYCRHTDNPKQFGIDTRALPRTAVKSNYNVDKDVDEVPKDSMGYERFLSWSS